MVAALNLYGSTPVVYGQKNDPPGTPVGPYLRGPGGLFNRNEIDNRVFSAFLGPMPGAANAIPVYNASIEIGTDNFGGQDASFDTLLTGVTAGDADDFANQPTEACADGPVGGLIKLGSIVNPFGNYKVSTREVEIYRAGRVATRLDQLTLMLMNAPVLQSVLGVPNGTPSLQNTIANELASRIYESIFSFNRMFAPRVWSGSPTNNSGERKDIVGFDIHINENNKRDALTSALLTAANSYITNYGFQELGAGPQDIVRNIEWADFFVNDKAEKQGFGMLEGFIAMRPGAFYRLSEVWPVRQYQAALAQMAAFTNGRVVVNASDAQEMRNAFRSEKMLPINGRLVRVVLDNTIFEDNSTTQAIPAGRFASDIYFIPTSVLGGIPVTYWQYFNHANTMSAAIERYVGSQTFTTDGGMFRWYVNHKNGCVKINIQMTPRLRMRTPQLAWRIQNVAYDNIGHLADWDPASSYLSDGGITSGQTQQFYNSWGSTPVAL